MTPPLSSRPGLVHQMLLYDSPQLFLATAVPFIEEGLNRSDPVLAVTSDANSALLRDELGPTASSVEFIDQVSWYQAPGRTLAACYRYVHERLDHHERVRFIGEPIWSGWDTLEMIEWRRFESMVNAALARFSAWMICSYDSRALPDEIVADARRTHPQIARATGVEVSANYLDPTDYAAGDRDLSPPHSRYESIGFDSDPAPVRRFVARTARQLGLAPPRVDDLVLAANEIATNAIRHGAGYGFVRMWRDGRRVLCEISDPGQAKGSLLGLVPPDPDADHGHGMWIARQLCDLLEVRAGELGTTIRLHMRAC